MEKVDFEKFKSLVKAAPALMLGDVLYVSSCDVNDLVFTEAVFDDYVCFTGHLEFSEKDFERYSKFPVLYDENTKEFHYFDDFGHGVKQEYVIKILLPACL